MKRNRLIYIVILFSVLLLAQSFLIFVSVNEMDGDAEVVNYSGLVRGATQRLVKLELAGEPSDPLIEKLDKYIDGLLGNKNEFNLSYMNDQPFQNELHKLQGVWVELKDCIYSYRAGQVTQTKLIDISEKHFTIADDSVHKAEYSAEKKLRNSKMLIFSGMFIILVIIVVSRILIIRQNKAETDRIKVLNEKNNELGIAIQVAEKANSAKSTFLANMSHDIRTPLHGVMGMTQIALDNLSDTKKLKECLTSITFSSKYLLSLINNVLDMSKIESNSLVLSETDINLPDFMETLIGITQQRIKTKKQILEITVNDVKHEHLLGDAVRINQVFINIVSNATKFTMDSGKITIKLKELPSRKNGYAYLQFTCQDTGLGMSEEFKKRIFESYSRENDTKINTIEGTGLGMSIVKKIVDTMGGQITVESEKGKGTTFKVDFDLKISNETYEISSTEQFINEKILFVDEDEGFCKSIVSTLSELNIHADYATTAHNAIAKVELAKKNNESYNLIIIDWKIQQDRSFNFANEVRRGFDKNVPIVLNGVYNWFADVDVQNKDITGYISKPLFTSALISILKEYTDKNSFNEFEAKQENDFNFADTNILIAEDNALNMEIATEILSTTGANIETVSNGLEAVEKFKNSPLNHFHIILMDVQMPIMDGYNATQKIRALPRTDASTVIIIAMTANAFDNDVDKSKSVGMNEHVSKPLDFIVLKSVIKKLKPTHITKHLDLLDELELNGTNVASGIERFAGKRDRYIKIIKKFSDDQGFNQLKEALANNDITTAHIAAHTLKGLTYNLAIDNLAKTTTIIDSLLKENKLDDAKITFEQLTSEYNSVVEIIKKHE